MGNSVKARNNNAWRGGSADNTANLGVTLVSHHRQKAVIPPTVLCNSVDLFHKRAGTVHYLKVRIFTLTAKQKLLGVLGDAVGAHHNDAFTACVGFFGNGDYIRFFDDINTLVLKLVYEMGIVYKISENVDLLVFFCLFDKRIDRFDRTLNAEAKSRRFGIPQPLLLPS